MTTHENTLILKLLQNIIRTNCEWQELYRSHTSGKTPAVIKEEENRKDRV